MTNIIGPKHLDCQLETSNITKSSFYHPNYKIWYYRKSKTFPGRKIGHITYVSDHELTPEEVEIHVIRMKHTLVLKQQTSENPTVGIIMGSISDLPTMQPAINILSEFQIPYEIKVVSAHRDPQGMLDYASNASNRGLKVIIAGAGGAAHLPGMVASKTTLPVIGVPINSTNSIQGIDSLLSICQMPGGIPVATMAVNGAKNAGLFAIRIIGPKPLQEIYQKTLIEKVSEMNRF